MILLPDPPWIKNPEKYADEYYYGCYTDDDEEDDDFEGDGEVFYGNSTEGF